MWVKKTYGEAIKELEVLVVERPAKGLGQEEAGQEIVKPTEAQSEEVATPLTETGDNIIKLKTIEHYSLATLC